MKHTQMTLALHQYLLDISLREHPALKALREKTAELALACMQISPEQGQFMQLLLRILGAKQVLELGTFTGYSALAFALAIPDDGMVTTCDINEEWTQIAYPYWEEAHQRHKIHLRLAPALHSLAQLIEEGRKNTFDFIFIDADKTNYLNYYEYALQLIRKGGLIAIDNIFWDGNVINPDDTSAQTREVRRLNAFIQNDDRVHVSLLPIADGLFLILPKDL